MAKINSINNSCSALISDTTLTATSGAITATLGDVVITSGNLTLPTTTSTAGQITVNAVPYFHAKGTNNLFLGGAGNFTTTGANNLCWGNGNSVVMAAVYGNILLGNLAGRYITSDSYYNVCIGSQAGRVLGYTAAGGSGVSHGNVFIGDITGANVTSGSSNICIGSDDPLNGYGAGYGLQAGDHSNILLMSRGVSGDTNTIRIGIQGSGAGQQNKAYIAGITGITVTGTAVLVASDGQLGIAVSSAKYKKDITDMPDMSQVINKLRPVTFHYKDEKQSAQLNYGLIAEEVEQVWPEMVAYDKDGEISTLYYQFLAPVLLKEIQKLNKRIQVLEEKLGV